MIKTFLIILLLNEIFTLTFNSSFSETQLPYIYMGQNNNIIIYNPLQNTKKELIHFFTKNNSLIYSDNITFQLKNFSQILTNESKIANGYFESSPTTSDLKVFYFNESYFISFIIKTSGNYISLESIGPENLILFQRGDANNINFVDFKFTSNNITMYIKKNFTLNERTWETNCNCTLTSTNKTVCGLIKIIRKDIIYYYKYYYYCYYTLISFNENTNNYTEKLIYNETSSIYYSFENKDNFAKFKFIKLVPLEDEKILYCFEENVIECSLIKLEGQNMAILKSQKFFYIGSGIKKNFFSAIKYKDNQVLLGLLSNNNVHIKKITINNNKFLSEDNTIKTSIYSNFYLKLLKNNNEDIILVTISKNYIEFTELSYSRCNNVSKTIYNGDKVNLNFDVSPSINNYNNRDNIIIINNGKELNSLVVGKEEKKLKLSEVYNKNDIFFKISSQDLDKINKYKNYSFEYSNSLNETVSQRCSYTLFFKECKSECDICTTYGNCYDKNGKSIVFKNKTDFEKYFIILPASILGMLIVLIFFSFAKCCMKEKMPNFGENAIVSEMPLITE